MPFSGRGGGAAETTFCEESDWFLELIKIKPPKRARDKTIIKIGNLRMFDYSTTSVTIVTSCPAGGEH